MLTCGLRTKPLSFSICEIFFSVRAGGPARGQNRSTVSNGAGLDTRTSRLNSGLLNTLIFNMSPGDNRYSRWARAVLTAAVSSDQNQRTEPMATDCGLWLLIHDCLRSALIDNSRYF
jgi:hypothetical protein